MAELGSLSQELLRKGRAPGLDAPGLAALAEEWRVLCRHPEYEGAPKELQAWVLAGLARTLRRAALARSDFAPFDEALPLLKRAQQLSRETDPEEHFEYRLDELRFRIERFRLSHQRNDIREAQMCGIRFALQTGGNLYTIGRWQYPGPLRWSAETEGCDFDGAECRHLVGQALLASYEVFGEGEELDEAIAYFELSVPSLRFDWAPLRTYAVSLAEALLARFARLHLKADAEAAVQIARRAVVEIPREEDPRSPARFALAAALLACHAAGAPAPALGEAITLAEGLPAHPGAPGRAVLGRLIRAGLRHDLARWLKRAGAELVREAGEHLLWRFRATGESAFLAAARRLLQWAVVMAEKPAARAWARCQLAQALTLHAMLVRETRLAESAEAAQHAEAAQTEAGEDSALRLQACFALGEALVAPFRTKHDPLHGLLGQVLPPAENSSRAAAAYAAAALNETPGASGRSSRPPFGGARLRWARRAGRAMPRPCGMGWSRLSAFWRIGPAGWKSSRRCNTSSGSLAWAPLRSPQWGISPARSR